MIHVERSMGKRGVGKQVEKYRLSDAFWERIEPALPQRPKQKTGRPRLPMRGILDGIFYVMRTGVQWNAVPREFGSSSSLHRYFQELVKDGFFERIWYLALSEYDELKGIDWKFQSMDGAMTKAPLAGEKNRAKSNGSRKEGNEAKPPHGRQGHSHRPRDQRRKHA